MKQMIKRILSGCLALMMVLGYVPANALGEYEYTQSMTFPVIEEGEEAPAPQGLGISTFAMVANDASYNYMYEGDSIKGRWTREFAILDADGNRIEKADYSDSWPVEVPSNGVFQLLDAEGNVVAASDPMEDYSYNFDYDTDKYYLSAYGVYFNTIMDGYSAKLPAGEYTARLIAGETVYPTDYKLMVVSDDCLMIYSLYTENMYGGSEYFDISTNLYGFRTESELADLSFELLDSEGNLVAKSTGRWRDIYNQSYRGVQEWGAYAEMKVAEGAELVKNEDYFITLYYKGDLTLFDAAGYANVSVYEPSYKIGGFDVIDAQTTSAVVNMASWVKDKEYKIEVREDYDGTVYASWEGTIPEDGIIPLQLTKGGIEMPATSYNHNFYVKLYTKYYYNIWIDGEKVETFRWEERLSDSFQNRYYNMRNENVSMWPYYANPNDKQIEFEISFSTCAYWEGEGDFLSMRDRNGIEVGRCDNLTIERINGYNAVVSGTLEITGTVKKGTYYLYLNNVQFDTIYLEENINGSRNIQQDYSNYTIYPFMERFPIGFEAINTSGKGYFVIREGATDGTEVLRSPLMTGEARKNRYHNYEHVFTKADYSKLTEGGTYFILFVDNDGREYNLTYNDGYTWTFVKSPLTLNGNNNNVYISWHSLEEGDQEIELTIYNEAKNFVESDLEIFKNYVITNNDTSETFVIAGWKDLAMEDDGYRAVCYLTFDKPVTAGEYTVSYNGSQVEYFEVYEADEYDYAETPRVYGQIDQGYLMAQNIKEEDVITAHIFQDYEKITEEAITFTKEEATNHDDEGYWYLYFDQKYFKNLADGDYDLRVYMNGEIMDTLTFEIYSPMKPIVTIQDDDDDWSDDGDPVVNSYEVSIEIMNIGAYGYLRYAETEELLAEQRFEVYMSNRWYGITFEGEDGPRNIFVELSPSGKADDPENLIYPLNLWLMMNPDYDLQVPDSIQGIHSNRNEYTFTATTSIPAAEVWISYYDEAGNCASQQMQATGKTEDGRYGFSLTVDPSDSFYDYDGYRGSFYYEDTRNISFFTTNLSTEHNSGKTYDGAVVGEPVERFFMFADPESIVILCDNEWYWDSDFTNDPGYAVRGYTLPRGSVTITETYKGLTPGQVTANEYGYFEYAPGNLTDGEYYFTVTDDSGMISSDSLRLTVDTIKPVITGATFDYVEGTALLRWGCSDNDVDYYVVYRNGIKVHEIDDKDGYGSSEYISFQTNVSARYNDGTLFKIVAIDYAGNQSDAIEVTTDDVTAPTAPGAPVAEVTKTRSVTITWSAASDNVMVDHYEIYRDGVKVGETTDLTYTDGQLSDNTAYVYTVKAVDTRNNVSEASAALNVTTQVAPEGAAVSGIVIKEEHSTITVGKTLALTVEITPADAVNKLVEWTSSDETVATVDENGVVTAVGEGEAVITGVTDDGAYVAETVVTVYPYLVQLVEAGRDEETGEIVYALQRYDESVAEAVAFITVYDENGKFVSVHEGVCEITENEMVFVNDKITVEEGQNVTIYLVDPTTFEPFCPEVEIE